MEELKTMTYAVTDRIARITLNRPTRGLRMHFERANLDPVVHVIALAGNGTGFCGGYDLVDSAEGMLTASEDPSRPKGSPLDPMEQVKNHLPNSAWDPMIDYAMMSRNVKGFMSLFHSDKPVVCKVHGFCVAGGTVLAVSKRWS